MVNPLEWLCQLCPTADSTRSSGLSHQLPHERALPTLRTLVGTAGAEDGTNVAFWNQRGYGIKILIHVNLEVASCGFSMIFIHQHIQGFSCFFELLMHPHVHQIFKGCRPCRRPRKNWQWMKPNWQKYLSVLRTCRFSPFSNVYFHEIYLICLNEIYLIKYLI